MVDNYASHQWISRRMGGAPDAAESNERVIYCEACGCENRGDPAEFPELQYPACDRKDD